MSEIKIVQHNGKAYELVSRQAKVGELVKVVGNSTCHSLGIGDIVEITQLGRHITRRVRTARHDTWMEPSDYKVLQEMKSIQHNGKLYQLVDRRAIVGEFIKVIGNSTGHVLEMGEIVEITRILGGAVATRRESTWMDDVDYLVLQEFPLPKVGDKVRSTTGKSERGYDVRTDVDLEVVRVYSDLYHPFGTIEARTPGKLIKNNLLLGTYEVVAAAPTKVKVGDFVRSTTGKSQCGYDVPTDTDLEVTVVYVGDFDEFIDVKHSGGRVNTLNPGTYELVQSKKNATVGQFVRSLTGKSQLGWDVPMKTPLQVVMVFESGAVNARKPDGIVNTLEAGTFEVIGDMPELADALKKLSDAKQALKSAERVKDEKRLAARDASAAYDEASAKVYAATAIVDNAQTKVDQLFEPPKPKITVGSIVKSINGLFCVGKLGIVKDVSGTTGSFYVHFSDGTNCWKEPKNIELVYAADHAISKSLAGRASGQIKPGDIVELHKDHPMYRAGGDNTKKLSNYVAGSGRRQIEFDPKDGFGLVLYVGPGGSDYAGLKTPVELRDDLSESQKMRYIGQ